MYIEAVPNRNSPPAVLLRESYRSEDGKVKKRTIANLSALEPQIIAGLKVLLKGGSASEQALEEQFEVERTLRDGKNPSCRRPGNADQCPHRGPARE